MPRKRDEIIRSLTAKGFEEGGGDHIFLSYRRTDGKLSTIRTKLSRGTKYKDVSDDLLGKMARQVRLPKGDFLDLIDCPLDQAGYEVKAQPS